MKRPRIRAIKEVRGSKKAKREEKKGQVRHLASQLELLYAQIDQQRGVVTDKLELYLERIEEGAAEADTQTSKDEYDQANQALTVLKTELNAKEKKTKRNFPNEFSFL